MVRAYSFKKVYNNMNHNIMKYYTHNKIQLKFPEFKYLHRPKGKDKITNILVFRNRQFYTD